MAQTDCARQGHFISVRSFATHSSSTAPPGDVQRCHLCTLGVGPLLLLLEFVWVPIKTKFLAEHTAARTCISDFCPASPIHQGPDGRASRRPRRVTQAIPRSVIP
jgi:hypothetical protein